MRSIGCRGYRFPPEIIHRAVWLYLRFTLSFRDVDNLLAERGIMVSGCKRMYLWRAVDAEGEVLDVLVQARRNKRAALKLMRKLLKNYGFLPERLVTDDLRSYGAAARDLGIAHRHQRGRWRNNRSRELASANPPKGTQDAGLQEPGFSPAISVRPCRHLQHLQRSTPSHFREDAPSLPSLGDGYVARGGRCSVSQRVSGLCHAHRSTT